MNRDQFEINTDQFETNRDQFEKMVSFDPYMIHIEYILCMEKVIIPQHVEIDHKTYDHGLSDMDLLVYAHLKKYMNQDTHLAFPSHQLIAKDAKIGICTVKRSIQHLIDSGDISKIKDGRKNVYRFNPNSEHFEMFSHKFLNDNNLSPEAQSYLLMIQPYFFEDSGGFGKLSYNDSELAEKTGLSEVTIWRRNQELTSLGILTSVPAFDSAGKEVIYRVFDLAKVFQEFVVKLKAQVQQNTEDIEELKKELELRRKQDIIRDELIRRLMDKNKIDISDLKMD